MTIPELSPKEFYNRWPQNEVGEEVQLLDVREVAELELASLPAAHHIPMGQIPQRLGELDSKKPIVVMCHGGARSLRVAQFLISQGFKEVFNLNGGIDAWSKQIDPKVPQY